MYLNGWNYLMVPLLSVVLKAVCGILAMTCGTPHCTVYDIRHRFITLNLKITTTCRISYVEYIFKTFGSFLHIMGCNTKVCPESRGCPTPNRDPTTKEEL